MATCAATPATHSFIDVFLVVKYLDLNAFLCCLLTLSNSSTSFPVLPDFRFVFAQPRCQISAYLTVMLSVSPTTGNVVQYTSLRHVGSCGGHCAPVPVTECYCECVCALGVSGGQVIRVLHVWTSPLTGDNFLSFSPQDVKQQSLPVRMSREGALCVFLLILQELVTVYMRTAFTNNAITTADLVPYRDHSTDAYSPHDLWAFLYTMNLTVFLHQ